MTETRIRWTEDVTVVPIGGSVSTWEGRVGNVARGTYLFLITLRSLGGDDYALCTELPSMGKKRAYDPDPDKLKAEAERWLAEFISSLGAVFPDAVIAGIRSRADELEATVPHDTRHERDMLLVGAGLRRAADLMEHGDQPAEPVPPHPEEESA